MQPKAIDVICQHTRKGELIPIKLRIRDEEGEFQSYAIRSYRDLSHQGTRTMPDGVYVTDKTLVYECKIVVFDRIRMVRLYYEPSAMVWKMTG